MQPDISVVVPMKNEAPNVEKLYRELSAALQADGRPYEIIIVDDGSTDGTFARPGAAARPTIRACVVIRFRRNFGQTAALAAGFDHAARRRASSRWTATSRTTRPTSRACSRSWTRATTSSLGWRRDRQDKFLSRKLPSLIANWLIRKVTGVQLHDYGCTLQGVSRARSSKPLKLYGEMHRFMPAIASELGVKTSSRCRSITAPREHGVSKYGISRTIRVILDLLTVKFLISYRTRPIQIFGLWGLVLGGIGAVILGWLGYIRLTTPQAIGDRPLLLLGILLMSLGVQLLSFGLLAEMMARTYHESQDKPTSYIRDILDAAATAPPAAGEPADTREDDLVHIKRIS